MRVWSSVSITIASVDTRVSFRYGRRQCGCAARRGRSADVGEARPQSSWGRGTRRAGARSVHAEAVGEFVASHLRAARDVALLGHLVELGPGLRGSAAGAL